MIYLKQKKKRGGLGFFGGVTAVEETWCDLQNSQKDPGRSEVVIKLQVRNEVETQAKEPSQLTGSEGQGRWWLWKSW